MSASQPERPCAASVPSTPSGPVSVAPGDASREPSAPRIWALALTAGVVAGLAAWLGGERSLDHFTPSLQWRIGKVDAVYRLKPTAASVRVAATRNAALGFGLLGASVGLALGVAGGLAGRSPHRALWGALTGLVLGGSAEAAVTYAALPSYYQAKDVDRSRDDLPLALCTHVCLWSVAGLAGGLAFGLGLGGLRRVVSALLGGLLGAALGAVVFELLGAVAFPIQAYTAEPISNTPGSRLLARLLVAVGTAAGGALGACHGTTGFTRRRETNDPPPS